jgi:transposase
MRPSVVLRTHLSPEQIRQRLYGSKKGHHASYWQIILSVSLNPGRPTAEYCAILGISTAKFYRVLSLYNEKGPEFCTALQWGGRRERRCQMSFAAEEALLQHWAAPALEGKVLVAKQLKEAVEEKLGHKVCEDYLWDLLHRHGWSKKAPRPEHPKGQKASEQRGAFKKKSLN